MTAWRIYFYFVCIKLDTHHILSFVIDDVT
jgi:hypothetical protein